MRAALFVAFLLSRNAIAFSPTSTRLHKIDCLYGSSRLHAGINIDDGNKSTNKIRKLIETSESSTDNSMLSPRMARIVLPLSTLLLNPALASAKASSSGGAFDQALKEYFPGSIPSTTVFLRAQSTLRKRQYYPYNTLIATSLPTDEIVNTPTSIVNQIRSKFSEVKDGGVYNLGGLGGIPFAGMTGVSDMLSHAQKDGRVLIIFGPNVGISKDGKVGLVERIGRSELGANETNGAIVKAYKEIISGKGGSSGSDFDLEMDYLVKLIEQMPLKEYSAKGGDDYAIAQITKNLYITIEKLIEKQVSAAISKNGNFWDSVTEVTLMGGIIVNRGHGSGTEGGDDFFKPMMMKTITKGGAEADLYPEVFGDLS